MFGENDLPESDYDYIEPRNFLFSVAKQPHAGIPKQSNTTLAQVTQKMPKRPLKMLSNVIRKVTDVMNSKHDEPSDAYEPVGHYKGRAPPTRPSASRGPPVIPQRIYKRSDSIRSIGKPAMPLPPSAKPTNKESAYDTTLLYDQRLKKTKPPMTLPRNKSGKLTRTPFVESNDYTSERKRTDQELMAPVSSNTGPQTTMTLPPDMGQKPMMPLPSSYGQKPMMTLPSSYRQKPKIRMPSDMGQKQVTPVSCNGNESSDDDYQDIGLPIKTNVCKTGDKGNVPTFKSLGSTDDLALKLSTPFAQVLPMQRTFDNDTAQDDLKMECIYATPRSFYKEHTFPDSILEYTVDNMTRALGLLALGKYVDIFRKKSVDGKLLTDPYFLENWHEVLTEEFKFSKFDAMKLKKFVAEGWAPNMSQDHK